MSPLRVTALRRESQTHPGEPCLPGPGRRGSCLGSELWCVAWVQVLASPLPLLDPSLPGAPLSSFAKRARGSPASEAFTGERGGTQARCHLVRGPTASPASLPPSSLPQVPLDERIIFSGNLFQYQEDNKKWRNRFSLVPHNYGLVLYENKVVRPPRPPPGARCPHRAPSSSSNPSHVFFPLLLGPSPPQLSFMQAPYS